jgi:ORF6N domain
MAKQVAPPRSSVRILTIRGQKVMCDGDLATIYDITTKRLNEEFRRNRKRFPEDFAFQLTLEEHDALRSQNATLKTRARASPETFTEQGALQSANVLRSERAIAMSVYVIRTFTELREKAASNAAILKRLAEINKTLLLHDSALWDIYEKLLPLLAPPAEPARRQIGFSA